MTNNILNRFKKILPATVIVFFFASCEDFLDRPDQSAYTLPSFYQNDEQLLQSVNILYSSPWHDFTRGYIGVGDVMSGNMYQGNNGFWKLTLRDGSVDDVLEDMSASLWSVNARANTILENINRYAGGASTQQGINTAKGEALVWKAMAYFYKVRIYGALPIVHNNSEMLATGEYNTIRRATIANVYEYIVMTLEQAIEWLPEENRPGRIDKYSAYGLLAKVHLTRAGVGRTGDRNQADLDKAREYAEQVVKNSGRVLEPVYDDIFRGSRRFGPEGLISWRWIANESAWTSGNPIQSDHAIAGFDEFGAWGNWRGPSPDLQETFGENALSLTRQFADTRRKATMMMYSDVYQNFWRDRPIVEEVSFPNGFDWTIYQRDVLGSFGSPTGANAGIKHLAGNSADHLAEYGKPLTASMNTEVPTHILRLADVYLVYAEAILGNAASTTNADALEAFNAVRYRAIANKDAFVEATSIDFEDIFRERRLELALEGDFWYDFVRLSYYKPEEAVARLNAQNRQVYTGISAYFEADNPTITISETTGLASPRLDETTETGQPYTISQLEAPFPEFDLTMNPNLMLPPVEHDMSVYKFD